MQEYKIEKTYLLNVRGCRYVIKRARRCNMGTWQSRAVRYFLFKDNLDNDNFVGVFGTLKNAKQYIKS